MEGTVTRSKQNRSTENPLSKKYKYETQETANKFTSNSLHLLHW